MLREFFYLLFATTLVSVNAVSAAEPAPGLQLNFRSAAAAKTWFVRQNTPATTVSPVRTHFNIRKLPAKKGRPMAPFKWLMAV